MEKQKAKYTYGILERQFRNLFEKANRSKGVTGEVLLQLCESRLDNSVFRLELLAQEAEPANWFHRISQSMVVLISLLISCAPVM